MHGHVQPRPDGRRFVCAGPGRCRECIEEAAALEAHDATQAAPQGAPEPQGGPVALDDGEARRQAAREALLGLGWVLPA